MTDGDDDRIAQKAFELWEAEGRPHGRDRDHWDQAKEIIALHDSAGTALLPRDTGAAEPVEEKSVAIDNEGEAPNLTDTGEHDLTAIEREPAITAAPVQPAAAAPKKAAAKLTAGSASLVKTGAAPGKKTKSRSKSK